MGESVLQPARDKVLALRMQVADLAGTEGPWRGDPETVAEMLGPAGPSAEGTEPLGGVYIDGFHDGRKWAYQSIVDMLDALLGDESAWASLALPETAISEHEVAPHLRDRL